MNTNGKNIQCAVDRQDVDALRGGALTLIHALVEGAGIEEIFASSLIGLLSVMDCDSIERWLKLATTDPTLKTPLEVAEGWVKAWKDVGVVH